MSDFKIPPAPSGKPAHGYAQILIEVWSREDWKSAEAAIHMADNVPFPFLMVACEHLIRCTAQKSGAGYEKAIDLLVEGALKSKGRSIPRKENDAD